MKQFTVPDAPKGLGVREAYVHVIQKYLLLCEAVADGKTLAEESVTGLKCAFCQNYRTAVGYCNGCPIRTKIHTFGCMETPWHNLWNAIGRNNDVSGCLCDEILFLLSLESTVKKMEATKV